MLFLRYLLGSLLVFPSLPVYAQQTVDVESAMLDGNRLELEAALNETGELVIVPKGEIKPYVVGTKEIDWSQYGVEPVWKFQDGRKLNVEALGDWYFTAQPDGEIIGIEAGQYTEGMGTVAALKNAPVGSSTFKTAGKSVIQAVTFTSPNAGVLKAKMRDLVTDTLNAMVLQGQSQVCSWPSRPETFEVNAKINVELGIGGEIELKTNWNTERLCAKADGG